MPFIGNQPAEAYSSFQKQDFTTSATTSYTLDHPVANGNEIALFINFVRQEPTAAYTASGTSLTLTSATSASDDMYCVYLGKAVQTVNPPNSSVGSSQVSADLITGQTALGATPADTDELLISDAGTLKRVDFSYLKSGITEADIFMLTSDLSLSANTATTLTGLARPSSGNYSSVVGRIGTGLSMSSGVLSFTNTGIYRVEFYSTFMNSSASNPRYCQNYINYSTDSGSSYNLIGLGSSSISEISSGGTFGNTFISVHVDVTNTSTHRMQFQAVSEEATSLRSHADRARTYVAVIRLGDT